MRFTGDGLVKRLHIVNPGLLEYGEALEYQKHLVELRQQEKIGDTLILLEHPAVITRGRRAGEKDILASSDALRSQGVSVFDIDRGGEATYHGPGQLVGYLIFHLYEKQRRLKEFVYNIEQVFIELLETNFDIHADREKKHRGVWVGNEKITAIGISIHNAVSMHGFAFNVNTNLDHYSWIIPCGITDKGVTSLKKITGRTQDMAKIKKLTASTFRRIFGYDSLKEESYGTYPET